MRDRDFEQLVEQGLKEVPPRFRRRLRNVVFVRGAEVGVTGTVLSAAVLLLPFCLVAGYTLTLGCSILNRRGDASGAGRVYVADSLGSVAGGALFSFVLVRFLDHIALLTVPALLNLAAAAWLGRSRRRESALTFIEPKMRGLIPPCGTATRRAVWGARFSNFSNAPDARALTRASSQWPKLMSVMMAAASMK